ncbi:MAG: hypothetical protein ACK2U9_23665, partial [Anaerolineae bacterium]
PGAIEIPPLYEEPVFVDPLGPVTTLADPLVRPEYERFIRNNSLFYYRGTAFDANGIVLQEVAQ